MIDAKRFRALCLALDDVVAVPHMDRVAFRTPRRIFATLAADGLSANVRLAEPQQQMLCAAVPAAFAVLAGGWGRQGWTRMDFAHVDEAVARDALTGAHALVRPAKKRR